MIRKKNLWLSTALMLMLGSCSTNDSMTGAMSLSNVSHSDCQTRSSSRTLHDIEDRLSDINKLFQQKLRLTYNESDEIIVGEYINYQPYCDYKNVGIDIKQDGDGTIVLNAWNDAPELVDCYCNVNIYFTIRNANRQNYHLILNERTIDTVGDDGTKEKRTRIAYEGNISFKDQSLIIIDL